MMWSRKNGKECKKEALKLFNKMKRKNSGDDQLTYKFMFKYLRSGEGAKYLLGHVDNDLGSKWERLSKRHLSLLYTLADNKIAAFSYSFLDTMFKSTIYLFDIIKDVRFIIFILIPLLPVSMPLVAFAVVTLVASELAKVVQLIADTCRDTEAERPGILKQRGHALLSPVLPVFLHHDELMQEIKLERLASINVRNSDEETAFTDTRRSQAETRLTKSELRATENFIEHFNQVVLSLSVLTVDGAKEQMGLTEGKMLFFFLSLLVSVLSIIRGQVNLISARKNGHLGKTATFLVVLYILVAVVPRGLMFMSLLGVILHAADLHVKCAAVAVFLTICFLHILASFWLQTVILKAKKNRFRQSVWTLLLPLLFLDWDSLYFTLIQEGYSMSIQECWRRNKYIIFSHNFLTLLGNIALDRDITGLFVKDLVSPEISTTIKFGLLALSPIILIGLSFLYYRYVHAWARVLNAELLPQIHTKCKSDPILNADDDDKPDNAATNFDKK